MQLSTLLKNKRSQSIAGALGVFAAMSMSVGCNQTSKMEETSGAIGKDHNGVESDFISAKIIELHSSTLTRDEGYCEPAISPTKIAQTERGEIFAFEIREIRLISRWGPVSSPGDDKSLNGPDQATPLNLAHRLHPGTKITFPTKYLGLPIFNESGLGVLDPDSIRILTKSLPEAEIITEPTSPKNR